eukprot:749706-Rhodomonas_salina.2
MEMEEDEAGRGCRRGRGEEPGETSWGGEEGGQRGLEVEERATRTLRLDPRSWCRNAQCQKRMWRINSSEEDSGVVPQGGESRSQGEWSGWLCP